MTGISLQFRPVAFTRVERLIQSFGIGDVELGALADNVRRMAGKGVTIELAIGLPVGPCVGEAVAQCMDQESPRPVIVRVTLVCVRDQTRQALPALGDRGNITPMQAVQHGDDTMAIAPMCDAAPKCHWRCRKPQPHVIGGLIVE